MKRLTYLAIEIIMAISLISCNEKQENIPSKTYEPSGHLKTAGWVISVKFVAGHEAGASCLFPYQGDIMPTLGNWVHIPCVGDGSNCQWELRYETDASYGSIDYNTVYSATAIFQPEEARYEESFRMPERSLLLTDSTSASSIGVSETDSGIWINIFEQEWIRIDSTHYCLTTGISFDTVPAYFQ